MADFTPDDALAELLCARLCHDLAGAVGAAAAGAELLEDGWDAETAQLVAASAAGAVARLKFFRAALGPAGSEQPAAAVRDLASSYLKASASAGGLNIALAWSCARPRLDGDMVRLALNLVLLARDALHRGGEVAVDIAATPAAGTLGISVGFAGRGAGLPEEISQPLAAGLPPTGPRGAQAWFCRRLMEKMGAAPRISTSDSEGRISG